MSKIAIVRQALLDLLREHKAEAMLPTSRQFLYYELIMRGVISKERTGVRHPGQIVTDALTQIREDGRIPWDWIVDETRSLDDYSGSLSIKQAVLDYLPYLRLDVWRGETMLVLTESRSLVSCAGLPQSIGYRLQLLADKSPGFCIPKLRRY